MSRQFVDPGTFSQSLRMLVIVNTLRKLRETYIAAGMNHYPALRVSLPAHPIPIYVAELQQSVCEQAHVRRMV